MLNELAKLSMILGIGAMLYSGALTLAATLYNEGRWTDDRMASRETMFVALFAMVASLFSAFGFASSGRSRLFTLMMTVEAISFLLARTAMRNMKRPDEHFYD